MTHSRSLHLRWNAAWTVTWDVPSTNIYCVYQQILELLFYEFLEPHIIFKLDMAFIMKTSYFLLLSVTRQTECCHSLNFDHTDLYTEIEYATNTKITTRHSRRTITRSEDTSLWQTYRSYSSISTISWMMISSTISFSGEIFPCFQHAAKWSLFLYILGKIQWAFFGISELLAKITGRSKFTQNK